MLITFVSELPRRPQGVRKSYRPSGSLYCYLPDGTLQVHEQGGIFCSNGIGWSPDDRTMFYTDSAVKVRLFV